MQEIALKVYLHAHTHQLYNYYASDVHYNTSLKHWYHGTKAVWFIQRPSMMKLVPQLFTANASKPRMHMDTTKMNTFVQ